jgi:hypothetical protein
LKTGTTSCVLLETMMRLQPVTASLLAMNCRKLGAYAWVAGASINRS